MEKAAAEEDGRGNDNAGDEPHVILQEPAKVAEVIDDAARKVRGAVSAKRRRSDSCTRVVFP